MKSRDFCLMQSIVDNRKVADANDLLSKVRPKPWNSESVLFSAVNSKLTRNVRSYFDRWREKMDASGLDYNDWSMHPTWLLDSRMPMESKLPVIKSCVRLDLTRDFF